MSILVVLNHRLENMIFWMFANIIITATITDPVIYISCLTCSTYCMRFNSVSRKLIVDFAEGLRTYQS